MDIILLFLAKSVDKHGTTLVDIPRGGGGELPIKTDGVMLGLTPNPKV